MVQVELTKAAAVSALNELIAVADSYSGWITEQFDAAALASAWGLPEGEVALRTAGEYLLRLGWNADAHRLVAETRRARRAQEDYLLAVGFIHLDAEELAARQEYYGPFPLLPSDPERAEEERQLLATQSKSVIAKLRRHAQRLKDSLERDDLQAKPKGAQTSTGNPAPAPGEIKPVRQARTAAPRSAKPKIVAALTAHHQYDNGVCDNQNPIGARELARAADVSGGAVSGFFKAQFGGHRLYVTACRDSGKFGQSMRMLNDELTPSILFNPMRRDFEAAE